MERDANDPPKSCNNGIVTKDIVLVVGLGDRQHKELHGSSSNIMLSQRDTRSRGCVLRGDVEQGGNWHQDQLTLLDIGGGADFIRPLPKQRQGVFLKVLDICSKQCLEQQAFVKIYAQ